MSEVINNPEFHVHFENRNVAFADGFAKLYREEKQCDLIIEIEGKKLKGHRHILQFMSKTFKDDILKGTLQFQPVEIKWRDASYDIVKGIFDYIYTGMVTIEKSDLEAFVSMAATLDIVTDLQDINIPAIMESESKQLEIIYDGWGREFAEGYRMLYDQKELFDVTFKVNGKELKAHRHLLSACSSYFEPMFNYVDTNTPLEVPLDDVSGVTYSSLKKLLKYLYYGEVIVSDIVDLLNAGEALEICGLERADDLQTERPNDNTKSSTIHVYARSKKIDLENEVVKCQKKETKVIKPPINESDSEVSADSSDNKYGKTRQRNCKGSNVRRDPTPKSTNNQKAAPNNGQKQKKGVAGIEPTTTERTWTVSEQRRMKSKKNVAVKSTKAEKQMVIKLTADEYKEILGKADESEEESNEHGKNHAQIESDKDLVQKSDANNNVDVGEFEYVQDYGNYSGYNSDDGAVGGISYVEDVTERKKEVEESGKENMVEVNNIARNKGGSGWNRGLGKNAQPMNDEDFNVPANFIVTERGATALAHNGYRYSNPRKRLTCVRWQCNKKISGKQCSGYAYTKKINGIVMVKLPPGEIHTHGPAYLPGK